MFKWSVIIATNELRHLYSRNTAEDKNVSVVASVYSSDIFAASVLCILKAATTMITTALNVQGT